MSRSKVLPFCLAAALLVSSGNAMAQTLSAEDLMNMPLENLVNVEVLVTGSSKYAQKTSEAPSIVTIITADDIKTYGYRTLGEALNGLHGFYLDGDQNYTSAGMRGFALTSYSDSRFLVMVDGQRMNENVYDSAYFGEEFMLDMSLIDHIEFIPGPGSSIYGANAIEGVVNVISKKGGDINGKHVELAGGTNNTIRGVATLGKTLKNGADIVLSASDYYSHGESSIYYPDWFDYATDLDQEYSKRLFAKATYGNFTYEGGFVYRRKFVPTEAYNASFNARDYYTTDQHAYGEMKYTKHFNDQTHIDLKGYYHWYDWMDRAPYNLFLGGVYINADMFRGDWAGGEATLVTTAFNRQTIVVGAEFQYDITQHLKDADMFGVHQDTENSGLRSGLYVQDDYKLRDNLILSGGLRVDQHHMIDQFQINPRLGVIWTPEPSTNIKLLYSSAYRAPNIFERQYNAFGSWVSNPDNFEEHVQNVETAVEWKGNDGLKLTGSVFFNEFRDVLNKDYTVGSPTYGQHINTGNLQTVGAEFGIEKKWDDGREFKLDFNHSEFIKNNGLWWGAVDDPKNYAKIRYAQPLFDGKAKIAFEDIYIGKRTTLYYLEHKPNHMLNVNFSSTDLFPILPPGTEVAVGLYNVADQAYDTPGGPAVVQDVLPMFRRALLVTLRKTF